MSSQAQEWTEKYREYVSNPLHDPAVALEMRTLLDYANTVDTKKSGEALNILNRKELS